MGSGPGGEELLAVVNHGGREAIELFAISFERGPTLEWRGCVPMPEGLMANDVAWLPDGGFVVTNFSPTLEGIGLVALWTGFEIVTGRETGGVYRWTPGEGLAISYALEKGRDWWWWTSRIGGGAALVAAGWALIPSGGTSTPEPLPGPPDPPE